MREKMTVEQRRRRRFTPTFRKEQVKRIESGEVTLRDVSLMYDVKVDSVRRWLVKYGQKALPEIIIIGHQDDYNRLRLLEKENKDLKAFIGDQRVNMVYMEKLLTIAKEKLGEDFEKKFASEC